MRENDQKYIIREGWISIIVNTFLFGLKYWAGIVSGSIALLADAWHTMTDTISSVVVLISGRISNKPADEEHPFGHGRAEHVAAIIVGVLLAIVAFDFILSAYTKFKSGEPGHFGMLAIIVTALSIVLKEVLARYAFWTYRKSGSSVLRADGWHHRSDSLSSVVILAGIFIGKYFWWIDSALALIVAAMIAYASYEILSKEIRSFLGEEVDPELVKEIQSAVWELLGMNVYIHHFHLHKYGNHQELSCHIKLPPRMPLNEAHAICTKIELMLKLRFELTATIHPEPIDPGTV